MTIPFTQYLLPDGRKRPISIDRPQDVEDMAAEFIEAGGWFEAEMLTTGKVSLTACMIVDDEPDDVEIVLTDNGPGIEEAVDKLVRAAVKHVQTGAPR